jgi:hypothetical protein
MSLHIANISFEKELEEGVSFIEVLSRPLYLQLQFLPFLYAHLEDIVAVSEFPSDLFWEDLKKLGWKSFPKICLFSQPMHQESLFMEPWGHTPSIATWAKQQNVDYFMPSWDVVRLVNSKEFSFKCSSLPGSALLRGEKDVERWLSVQKLPFVLKTCFGASAQGHLICDSLHLPKIKKFLRQEWDKERPVIAEPWHQRLLDFSTQWLISREGEVRYLGVTICENEALGSYRGTIVGDPVVIFGKYYPFLQQHLEKAEKVVNEIKNLGYFGNLGIDAMIYKGPSLQPIVEINARKTMGFVALSVQKKFSLPFLKLRYEKAGPNSLSLLPTALIRAGTLVSFSRQLFVDF